MKTTGLVETIKETKEVFLTSIVVILLNIYLVGYLYEQNLLNLDFTYGYHIIVGMMLVAGLLYSVKLKFIVNRFYKNKAIILICIISGILFKTSCPDIPETARAKASSPLKRTK